MTSVAWHVALTNFNGEHKWMGDNFPGPDWAVIQSQLYVIPLMLNKHLKT